MAIYVKNSELLKEILASKEKGELTPGALTMLIRIVNEISKTMSYKRPEDKEDCIAFAIVDIIRYWRGFNPDKSNNAFSYYSQIAKNGLGKGYKKVRGNVSTTMFISIDEEHGIGNI